MLNTEVLWTKALTGDDVRGITRWLQSLTTEGQADVDKSLAKFNCWLQCSIKLTKKELLSLCFGQCHGQWMFLDQTSFTKLCLLIQKLKNLLLLAHWDHKCVMCQINSNAQCRCWTTVRQHILLGRLVQWCSVSGLLPQYPDANRLKQVSRMWQEMNQQHETTCLELQCDAEDKYRGRSIIQCMVAYMHKQYGPLRVSEDGIYQTYPPPSLNSLLKLVLVPYRDTTFALAICLLPRLCDEASETCSFLDLKPLRKALLYTPGEKSLRSFCYDPKDAMDQPEILTSCALTEDMQIHDQTLTLKAGEPEQPSSLASVRSSLLVMDFNPVQHGSRPHQPQISLGASLLPLSPGNEGKNVGIKEVACFRTTTDRVGDCKQGSWWKQALETRSASTGLLPAIEQIPAVTKEKRHSLVLGWPQSHGLVRGFK